MGQKWKGGDMQYPGGGFKINLLRQGLEKYKDDTELVILVVDR